MSPRTLQADFAFEARVTIAPPLVMGPSSHGLRSIVPITGGTFEGPRLRGRVLPGADSQFVRPDGVLELEAHYTLETEDGAFVRVVNRGLRHGPPEVIERLVRGERVDPSTYYFRAVPTLAAPVGGKYDWLNRAIFVSRGERQADAVVVQFFEIK